MAQDLHLSNLKTICSKYTKVKEVVLRTVFSFVIIFTWNKIFVINYVENTVLDKVGHLKYSMHFMLSMNNLAVVYVGGYSSDSTPSLGNSICYGCGPKNKWRKIEGEILIVRERDHKFINIDIFSFPL